MVIPAVVVALSAVGHGLALWIPMPEREASPSAVTTEPEPEDMSVVVLPEPESSAPPVPASPPQAAPAAPIAPPPAAPPLLPTNVIPEPPAAAPPPSPPPTEPAATAPPVTEPLPIAEEATPAFDPPAEPELDLNDGPLTGYGDRFPHFEGAVGGCFGLSECRQVSGVGSYRAVARSLIAGLEDQGYLVTLRDDLEDTGRNVYELTPPGNAPARQFLMVFSNTDGSAIYVMSPDVMTLDELKALSAADGGDRPTA